MFNNKEKISEISQPVLEVKGNSLFLNKMLLDLFNL